MCGIVGAFLKNEIDQNLLINAVDVIAHRGPDAAGYYQNEDKNIFLGHRRLSIIDISEIANQPMYSSCGNYVIVYNGEVYNYKELKNKLPDFCWQTTGDTEVILELFAHYGAESFKWLNGIFAFSIYDIAHEKLWLCRDQLGIKPLFIQKDEEKLVFASELKSIVAINKSSQLKISRTAVAQFLHLGYIPEPLTIYRGIKKFPAGNYAVFDVKTREWQRHQYWQAKDYYLCNPISDEQTALIQYKEKLFAAVESQLMSDVPLGTFLSGGIDSSLVTAVASRVSKTKVKTFSIGFEDADHDESVYANMVAQHLNTEHHSFKVKQNDILQLVPEFLSVYDEPFADSSAFPTMLVSKLAREHVTVTLSGDGGDEFFQGYGMYQWAKRLSEAKYRATRKPIVWASKLLSERYQRAATVFNYSSVGNIPSHIFSQEQYLFSEHELKLLLQKNKIDFANLNILPSKGSAQEKQAFWDIEHYLKDDLLVKVDRASMHYSLETRVPLLDKNLVELALNIPLGLKVNEEYGTKYLMKKVLYEMVPREIFERPKKGFSIPLSKWLAKELKPLVDKYLSQEKIEFAGFVKYGTVKKYLDDYLNGKTMYYNRVWAILVLHWWYYEQHNNRL